MEAAEGDPGEVAGVIEVRHALETAVHGGSLDAVPRRPARGRPRPMPRSAATATASRSTSRPARRRRWTGPRAVDRVTEATGQAPFVLLDYIQKVPVDRRRGGRADHRRRRGPQGPRPVGARARRRDLGRRQGGPRLRPPDAHPRPARVVGAGLRGRRRPHRQRQGRRRLARAPRLQPRQHPALPRLVGASASRRTATARPTSSSSSPRTSSTAASTRRARRSPSASSTTASSSPEPSHPMAYAVRSGRQSGGVRGPRRRDGWRDGIRPRSRGTAG